MIHVQCVEIKKDPKGLVTVVGATDLGVTSEQQLLTTIEQVSSCVAHHVHGVAKKSTPPPGWTVTHWVCPHGDLLRTDDKNNTNVC
jgi:hypothetical protein